MSTLLILIFNPECESYCGAGEMSFWGSYNSPTAWFIICGDTVKLDHVTVHRSMPSDLRQPFHPFPHRDFA